MALSPYVAALRARVAHDLVLLPSVAVLPLDGAGRLLLVRNADTGDWQTVGGAIEPDESPRDAAAREALEETGAVVAVGRLLDVLGGPAYRVRYPNGDEAAYVVTVYEGSVLSGTLVPDGEETSDVAWWRRDELGALSMGVLTRTLLAAVGMLPPACGTAPG